MPSSPHSVTRVAVDAVVIVLRNSRCSSGGKSSVCVAAGGCGWRSCHVFLGQHIQHSFLTFLENSDAINRFLRHSPLQSKFPAHFSVVTGVAMMEVNENANERWERGIPCTGETCWRGRKGAHAGNITRTASGERRTFSRWTMAVVCCTFTTTSVR
jgi:hypothetical protein